MLNQKKSCSNCIKGTAISVNNDILCRDHGAVSPNYVCSKHRFSPSAKLAKEPSLKCVNCENFILNINSHHDAPIGLCQLFSVRQFDGRNKNACSKFVTRQNQEVS